MKNDLVWKIGGEAGFGIMAAGAIFSKALVRAGLYIATTVEYPSLIRGGHNVYIIRASKNEIFSLLKPVDLLVALNQETINLHKDELSENAAIIYDSKDTNIKFDGLEKDKFLLYPIPLLEIATKDGGAKIMMNNVALGASWAVLDLPFEILASVISDVFKAKGNEVIQKNTQVCKEGFEFTKKNLSNGKDFKYKLSKGKAPKRLVLTGNEAIGLGAIQAGLGAAFIYPMTPINGLLTFLAAHEKEFDYIFKQPEDEIAGINMAIGASYAGKRSLVATSGGGFDLMVEGYSMAAMTEIPLVVVMGIRPGPSSGLPTWTSQADLKFMLSASQGDFMRVVLTPGDPEECFELTQVAFNLADKYQTPVIILVDKFLCESLNTMSNVPPMADQMSNVKIDRGKTWNGKGEYKRYQITADGISPRALPGQTYFVTNSYEHDEFGYSTEDAKTIKAMVEKRGRKYETLAKEVPEPIVYGDKDADVTLVGWGSTKAAALETISNFKFQISNLTINYLHLNWINPFPKEAVARILSKAKKVIDVEGNSTGQMAGWIREQTGIEIKDKILGYDGRPFYPEDIIEGIKHYV